MLPTVVPTVVPTMLLCPPMPLYAGGARPTTTSGFSVCQSVSCTQTIEARVTPSLFSFAFCHKCICGNARVWQQIQEIHTKAASMPCCCAADHIAARRLLCRPHATVRRKGSSHDDEWLFYVNKCPPRMPYGAGVDCAPSIALINRTYK